MGLLDMGVKIALNKLVDSAINPRLAGIGKVEEVGWKDKELQLLVRLEDLEDHPLQVVASKININHDGSSVTIGSFKANKKIHANGP